MTEHELPEDIVYSYGIYLDELSLMYPLKKDKLRFFYEMHDYLVKECEYIENNCFSYAKNIYEQHIDIIELNFDKNDVNIFKKRTNQLLDALEYDIIDSDIDY